MSNFGHPLQTYYVTSSALLHYTARAGLSAQPALETSRTTTQQRLASTIDSRGDLGALLYETQKVAIVKVRMRKSPI
jgi:hypothetical protein